MRIRILSALPLVLLAGCASKNIQTKEAVQEAVLTHLAKVSGLDVAKMDVDITNMSFQADSATVGVSIAPKGMPGDAMQMGYELKREGDRWVVAAKKRPAGADGHGGVPIPPGGGAIPPGHPPVPEAGKK